MGLKELERKLAKLSVKKKHIVAFVDDNVRVVNRNDNTEIEMTLQEFERFKSNNQDENLIIVTFTRS